MSDLDALSAAADGDFHIVGSPSDGKTPPFTVPLAIQTAKDGGDVLVCLPRPHWDAVPEPSNIRFANTASAAELALTAYADEAPVRRTLILIEDVNLGSAADTHRQAQRARDALIALVQANHPTVRIYVQG